MPGILTFDKARVELEIQRVEAATEFKKYWDKETGPGLWLVGDQGVYFMGNHADRKVEDGVAYAAECDPTNPDPDNDMDWYDNKREIFGGDDGVEFFELDTLKKLLLKNGAKLVVSLTDEAVEMYVK